MKRSTDRFLTTHTGSLPRPDDLIRMMFAKEEGVPVDARGARGAHAARPSPRSSQSQTEAGIDIVNDGEMSKPSYATYVKDRLDRLRRHRQHLRLPGPRGFPEARRSACSAIRAARAARRRPATRPIAAARPAQPQRPTSHNLKAALAGVGGRGAFMSAASPGVDLAVLPQRLLPEPRGYLFAHRRGDARTNTRPSPSAGFMLQIDCPDLAMGRHIQYADLGLADFRKRARLHIEALNHALAQHPAGAAAHASVLGQLRGPAPLRRAARRHHRHRVRGAPERDLVRGRQSAPRARVDGVRARASCPTARC